MYIKFKRIDFVDEKGNWLDLLSDSAKLEAIFNSGKTRNETDLKIELDGSFGVKNSVLLIKTCNYRFNREDKIKFTIN